MIFNFLINKFKKRARKAARSLYRPKDNRKISDLFKSANERDKKMSIIEKQQTQPETIDELMKCMVSTRSHIIRHALTDNLLLMGIETKQPEELDLIYTGFDGTRGYQEEKFEDILNSLGIFKDMFRKSVQYDGDILIFDNSIDISCVSNVNMNVRPEPPKYIVIHYVVSRTSKGGQARNVAKNYVWNYENGKSVSSEFTVDDDLIVQYCPDPTKFYCFAAGGANKYRPKSPKGGRLKGVVTCKNSISIEVCNETKYNRVSDPPNSDNYYFTEATLNNTVKLTRILMNYYGIPKSNVCRHYDCAGKTCPGIKGWNDEPGSEDESKWYEFLSRL